VDALQYIPDKSALAIGGTNLNQLWNHLSGGLAKNETLKVLQEQTIASLESLWGINLPEDVFNWVEGEYALSLLPRPDRTTPDWLFVVEKSAGAKGEKSIEHLDKLAKERGLSVGLLPLGDQTITAWTKLITSTAIIPGKDDSLMKLEAQVQGVHTALGKYEIFTSSVEAMNQALKGPENSLVNSENFQSAIAALPGPNDGYLYLDWEKSKPLLERQLPIVRVVEILGNPLFDHLRSLSVSSYGIAQGVQRSKLFFQFHNAN
jgi:hypothetical protein